MCPTISEYSIVRAITVPHNGSLCRASATPLICHYCASLSALQAKSRVRCPQSKRRRAFPSFGIRASTATCREVNGHSTRASVRRSPSYRALLVLCVQRPFVWCTRVPSKYTTVKYNERHRDRFSTVLVSVPLSTDAFLARSQWNTYYSWITIYICSEIIFYGPRSIHEFRRKIHR